MRILIDIGHPAHVHLFRNLARELILEGFEVLFTCREKEFEKDLLEYYGLPYRSLGKKYSGTAGKVFGIFKFGIREYVEGLRFKPDLLLSHGSYIAAHAAALLRKPHIALEDTFNFEQICLYKPFTRAIITGDFDHPLKSGKVVRYTGCHELAYLHPSRFVPDESVIQELSLSKGEKYAVMRFVSWKASHDVGHKGISLENKMAAVRLFSGIARVFISSEGALPPELEEYRLMTAPHRIHDVLAFASLLWTDSFTMPSECSVLGTPSVVIHNSRSFPLEVQRDRYGLCFTFSESTDDQIRAMEKGEALLKQEGIREEWRARRDRMISENIDLTDFLLWFVKNWPESHALLMENPDYQKMFVKRST